MNDESIVERITALVEREHELRQDGQHHDLQALEVELDQCWDLLRQRRARREFGTDPDGASARPAGTVEGYLQ